MAHLSVDQSVVPSRKKAPILLPCAGITRPIFEAHRITIWIAKSRYVYITVASYSELARINLQIVGAPWETDRVRDRARLIQETASTVSPTALTYHCPAAASPPGIRSLFFFASPPRKGENPPQPPSSLPLLLGVEQVWQRPSFPWNFDVSSNRSPRGSGGCSSKRSN